MHHSSKIYVAGHRGLVGAAIMRNLTAAGYKNLLTRTHEELDLTNQAATERFFETERPEYVFLAAAKVGGIHANNTYPAEFIYANLAIAANVIHAAWRHNVKKLIYLGSSCIYPKHAPQPIQEKHLLTGPLEPTNAPYAIAKIAGIKLCESYWRQYGAVFMSVMPTNLYGIGDNFDLQTSHVLPALLRKCHEAKVGGQETMTLWGSGSPKREFLFADDLADACVYLMVRYGPEELGSHVNIGSGQEVSIKELAQQICATVGFDGEFEFDTSKPDGTPRKLLDTSHLERLGWKAQTSLQAGLNTTYEWYLSTLENG